MATADEAKAKGNAAFAAGNFSDAVRHFSDAIALSPSNHVLFSNRSAAHASLGDYASALSDAQTTVSLNPSWPKGYSRLGAAHLGLADYDSAIAAYNKGLELDPSNDALKSGLADAQSAAARAARPGPAPGAASIGGLFQGPEVWAKLTADPATRGFLQQPDFLAMMSDVQRNPNNVNKYLGDQRMMQALGVLLNMKLRTATPEEMEREAPVSEAVPPEPKKPAREPEPEPMGISEEEKGVMEKRAAAQKEKEAGNAAYKKKDFDAAIAHYSKAIELDDEDISFLTNRAAVYLEMGKVRSFLDFKFFDSCFCRC